MKVLSIKEPFASLISKGVKKVETRSWKTKYRGELYIHASLTKSKFDHKHVDFLEVIDGLETKPGYILCKCNLIDCVYMDEEYINDMKKNNYTEYLCGGYSVGRYGWVLEVIEVIDPVIAKGQLGIWNYVGELK